MPQLTRTSFRVLDALSRAIGSQLPVSVLRGKVEERFGTGHYKNVHESVTELADAGFLTLEKAGRTKLVSLHLDRVETIDLLAEIDLRSKRERKPGAPASSKPPSRIAEVLLDHAEIGTAFLVDAEANRTLNRLEVVIAARPGEEETSQDADRDPPRLLALQHRLEEEARVANVRLDALLLTEHEFRQGLSSSALHPVQAQAKRRSALVDPQRFWWLIRKAKQEGPPPRMRVLPSSTDPPLDLVTPIHENPDELGQHLDRFGYTEAGTHAEITNEVCLELVIAAALRSGAPRRRYASAVLLSKNRANPRMMAFLARKHGLVADLLGVIDAIRGQPSATDLQEIEAFLPEDTEPRDVERDRVQEMLDLYGAA